MRNIWKEFNKLHTLSIQFANSGLRQTSLYANGHHQVQIWVTLKISDLNNKPLQITQQDLQQALYLCDYHTGNRLSAPWIISFVENAYNLALSCGPVRADEPAPTFEHGQDHNANISFYLSCEPQCHGGLIAIALDVPGVGVFNTTESGTDTKNSPAGAGSSRLVHPLYISVTPLPAIYYSDPAHMQMEIGEEETLTNTWWEALSRPAGLYQQHWNGKLSRRIIAIRPKTHLPDNRFMQSEFVCKPVNNEACTQPDGDASWHGVPVRRFDVVQGDAYPCAVISQALPDYYQLNIWYAHNNTMTINAMAYNNCRKSIKMLNAMTV